MSKLQKLIEKLLNGRNVSFDEAENILTYLGFKKRVNGSHHVFFKNDYEKNISIKRRSQLLSYQINDLREVLKDHGY